MIELYSNAYTATTTKGLFDKTSNEAKLIKTKFSIDQYSGDIKKENNIYIITGDDSSLPIFIHPFFHDKEVYIDARAFTAKDGKTKNVDEYRYLKRRALLDLGWNKEHEMFEGLMEFTLDVFSTWIAGNLTRALSLTPMINQNIKIASAIYYMGLFLREKNTYSFDTLSAKIIKVLSRSLRIPGEIIDEFITLHEELIPVLYFYENNKLFETNEKLITLCLLCTKIVEDAVKITPSVVYTSCCSGTFSLANSNEIAMIMIEHPPYLMNIMNYCLSGGFLAKLKIGVATLSVNKKHNVDSFSRAISYFIKEGDE